MRHRLVVAGLLAVLLFVRSAAADAPADKSAQVRERINQLKLGTTVEMTLQDGSTASGMLLDVSDRGVVLQSAPSAEPHLIEYSRVKAVQPGRGGEPFGFSDPIRPGMLLGLVLAAAIALVWAVRRRRVGELPHT